eukprot:2222138-Rhodomonas_salina.3
MLSNNLSLVQRRNLDYSHYPLSKDEDETISMIIGADINSDITLAPTHHIDNCGTLHGFRVAYPQHTAGVMLPISREMFFGHTIAEASVHSESNVMNINTDVMKLVSDQGRCRTLMRELLEEIDIESNGHEAGLHCIPQNVNGWEQTDGHNPDRHNADRHGTFGQTGTAGNVYNSDTRATDSQPWKPELPIRVGIYHSFVRGFSKDTREHKVYISCTGGCTLAAESYYNLLLDIGTNTDVDEVVDSEETFWLRNASYRSRCRTIQRVADKFGINIKSISDINSYDDQKMALSTTDTVYNNITLLLSGHVAVFNDCVDTTTSKNGIVNTLHPSEGLWIYKGTSRSSGGMSHLGFGFGDQKVCGIFPSSTFHVTRSAREKQLHRAVPFSTIYARNTETVVTYKCDEKTTPCEFSWPDEKFLGTLQKTGWDRNNGIVELMPIIVGVTRWPV